MTEKREPPAELEEVRGVELRGLAGARKRKRKPKPKPKPKPKGER